MRTGTFNLFGFLRRCCDGDDFRAGKTGNLHAVYAKPAAGPCDQHAIARTNLSYIPNCIELGAYRTSNNRRMVEGHLIRYKSYIVLFDSNKLGITSVEAHVAQHHALCACTLAISTTVAALATYMAALHSCHTISSLKEANFGANLPNSTRDFMTRDYGNLNAPLESAIPHNDVVKADAACLNFD
ncbi:hypothetical protein C7450_12913 [Chelatococcus asaccharovorans]|uniref:Uncharacterized protein n=1 Tax=Chelatococcus asaccharovorans TaxID=28210 RepID=A0A2V3TRW4_9HYPH|nr:hypothetical protein C7450_12913 [Chelatococcus asaccharovorans]